MTKQTVNLGVVPNGVGGDDVRTGFTKVNENFTELYTTPTQAEAEAGTSQVVKGWTAQRIRQSITAWYTGISGAIGRTILGRSTADQVRDDIGLGTAATRNAGNSRGEVLLLNDSHLRIKGAADSSGNLSLNFGGDTGELARLYRAGGTTPQFSIFVRPDSGAGYVYSYAFPQIGGEQTVITSANLTTSNTDGTAGRVLKVGDGGWMGQGAQQTTPYGYPTSITDVTNQTKAIRSTVTDNGIVGFSTGIHFAAGDGWGRLRVDYAASRAWIQGGLASAGTGWTVELYHTGNTTKNPDGTLKASSPVINLYTDKHDLHNESQFGATPTAVRKSKGVYEITGTLGLRSEGWYLDTPSDRNGNKYFNIEWTQNITPDAEDGVVDEYRDDIVVTIETFERVWNKDTGLFENGTPMDINELQDRFVQLRFNELKVEHGELDDDTN